MPFWALQWLSLLIWWQTRTFAKQVPNITYPDTQLNLYSITELLVLLPSLNTPTWQLASWQPLEAIHPAREWADGQTRCTDGNNVCPTVAELTFQNLSINYGERRWAAEPSTDEEESRKWLAELLGQQKSCIVKTVQLNSRRGCLVIWTYTNNKYTGVLQVSSSEMHSWFSTVFEGPRASTLYLSAFWCV